MKSNIQIKCRNIFMLVLFFLFCLGDKCNALEPKELYTGFRNKEIIRLGFHETLYGVWSFKIDSKNLIISGLEWNGWSGTLFGRYYSPHYTKKLWEKQLELNKIEMIIAALNKATNWAKISNAEKLQNYKKDLVKLGQGISIYFKVSELGKNSVVFRNDYWIFKDRIRGGGFVDRFIELSLSFEHNENNDTVTDMINSLNNYKEIHQEYLRQELTNRKLQLQNKKNEDEENKRIEKLFQ